MAIEIIALDQKLQNYQASTAFASANLSVDDLVYVAIDFEGSHASTVTSSNLTFTEIFSGDYFSVFEAIAGSNLTDEVITCNYPSAPKSHNVLVKASGANTTRVQTVTGLHGGDGAKTISLSALGDAANVAIGFISVKDSTANIIDAAHTTIYDGSGGEYNRAAGVFYEAGVTALNYSIVYQYGDCEYVGIELAEADGGGEPATSLLLTDRCTANFQGIRQ